MAKQSGWQFKAVIKDNILREIGVSSRSRRNVRHSDISGLEEKLMTTSAFANRTRDWCQKLAVIERERVEGAGITITLVKQLRLKTRCVELQVCCNGW